jgi:hypothetical protein
MSKVTNYHKNKGENHIHKPDVRRTPESKQPKSVIAVDPGDAHVGMAIWSKTRGIQLLRASEFDADKWLSLFAKLVENVDIVVIEEFRLYPGKAKSQAWSPMATAEMIGAMKWIAHEAGKPVILQGADIKNPTRRQCKARGLTWKHKSVHASDAILHLQHYIIRQELQQEV